MEKRRGSHKRMLNIAQVLKIVPVARRTLLKMEKEGRFPTAIFISDNRKVWLEDDIVEWQARVVKDRPRKPRRR